MRNAFKPALNVLLADRDRGFAESVRGGLEGESCAVKICFDGGSGLRQAEDHAYDVILLDVMLPVLDGVEVTKRLRLLRVQTPILLLASKDASEDLVKGLEAGADDYVPKSVGFDVLLARIRARTRSAAGPSSAHLRFADLFLDLEKREAVRAGKRFELTRTEFLILECLMQSAGRIVRRSRIIDSVWKDRFISENNLDVFIRFLRAKVDRPELPRLLHTERGVGFSIRECVQ
jgi:DNA-binding response OmpR family regulator